MSILSKKKKPKFYVYHPRYGDKPRVSGYKFSAQDIQKAHWRYSSVQYFIDTAIPADIEKQNYSIYPRSLYVDIKVQCEVCQRWFIFFAQEQKYWFEQLGFWIDAHCTRCIDCRKKDQEIRQIQVKYQELVSRDSRTLVETKQLKNIALALYQLGYIRDIDKINKIRT